ncbi:MAG: peptidoglycan DD-metalloendopeptidase family protein [Tannerella sp.]|jgi:septal ring factor EnvC (AmiA/AmiB activator)|nr:peptidoglycan DD-metalloendopeptidase family protein [Tannerella sp.]
MTLPGYIRIFLLLTLIFISTGASGQILSLKQLEAQRKAALEEIASTQQLLNETSSLAKNSLNRLNLISEQILARKKVILLLNQEIALIDRNLTAMNSELTTLEKDLHNQRQQYVHALQNMQRRRSSQYKWLFILSAENFTQSFRRMRYLHEYAEWRKQQAKQIVYKQEVIKQKQTEMEETRAEKLALLDDRERESSLLQKEESTQKNEYRQLDRKRKSLQEQIDRKKKQAEELNRQIERLIASEIDHSTKDNSVSRKADTAGGYAMTKEEKTLSDNFASNRRRLPFPLTGKYKIVTAFGEHRHPFEKRVTVKSNGIDIQTVSGTEAQTVFQGVVTKIFVVTGGFGVIVRHGNYLTIYINLSETYVKTGDRVAVREKLGKIFTNPETGETILHFEIRKEKDALNPELWLD